MVVYPTSAKGFYEIRSNVSPITLGQRCQSHQFPTDGQRRADPLPTSIRHWVNVGSTPWWPSANGCTSDIGPMFLWKPVQCSPNNVGPTLLGEHWTEFKKINQVQGSKMLQMITVGYTNACQNTMLAIIKNYTFFKEVNTILEFSYLMTSGSANQ